MHCFSLILWKWTHTPFHSFPFILRLIALSLGCHIVEHTGVLSFSNWFELSLFFSIHVTCQNVAPLLVLLLSRQLQFEMSCTNENHLDIYIVLLQLSNLNCFSQLQRSCSTTTSTSVTSAQSLLMLPAISADVVDVKCCTPTSNESVSSQACHFYTAKAWL